MQSTSIRVQEMLDVLEQETIVLGSRDVAISRVKSVDEAEPGSMVWMGVQPEDIDSFITDNPAAVFIFPLPVPGGLQAPPVIYREKD